MKKEHENPFRNAAEHWSSTAEHWPSKNVARLKITDFTGGAISPKSMQNMDSLEIGPRGRFRLGKIVVYPLDQLVEWLEARSSTIEERDPAEESPRMFPGKKK